MFLLRSFAIPVFSFSGLLWFALSVAVAASPEEAMRLPEPLTLEDALELAAQEDPALQQVAADVALARAGLQEAQARTGLNVAVEGRLRWIDPPDNTPDDSREDHKLGLLVRKNLYDFGRSAAGEAAAALDVAGGEQQYLAASDVRRIEVMRQFFAVLRADLDAMRDDEAMAVAYVELDRLRQRHELGQISDVDLLAKESEYQQARRQRAVSQTQMRAARARLAISLNRPGMLPSALAMPELPAVRRSLPDYQLLLDKAMADNPRVKALQQHVAAAQQRLEGARAGGRPRLSGELEAAEYSRSFGSNDALRAGLYLEFPLYDGGTTDAAVAREAARLHKLQAQLTEAQYALRQQVLELWLQLSNVQTRLDEVTARRAYRDLYLDRSRANYEMEVKADLGDAMVRLTEAQRDEAVARFEATLAWETLDALTGGPLPAADDRKER